MPRNYPAIRTCTICKCVGKDMWDNHTNVYTSENGTKYISSGFGSRFDSAGCDYSWDFVAELFPNDIVPYGETDWFCDSCLIEMIEKYKLINSEYECQNCIRCNRKFKNIEEMDCHWSIELLRDKFKTKSVINQSQFRYRYHYRDVGGDKIFAISDDDSLKYEQVFNKLFEKYPYENNLFYHKGEDDCFQKNCQTCEDDYHRYEDDILRKIWVCESCVFNDYEPYLIPFSIPSPLCKIINQYVGKGIPVFVDCKICRKDIEIDENTFPTFIYERYEIPSIQVSVATICKMVKEKCEGSYYTYNKINFNDPSSFKMKDGYTCDICFQYLLDTKAISITYTLGNSYT